ncbi:hypothetical protein [Neisseria yangbaofengii]|uniref:hypothetical protein n=1 Tax=Neisseria yangbaofengii TaxID=2709396 RepID=UPI0013E9A6B1|nr:hypothetical protein [Neisseria yangbaofengii]
MMKNVLGILAPVWAGFGLLSAIGFIICSLEYIAVGNAQYLQRFAVVDGIALLVLLPVSAAVCGVARYVLGDEK